jgi:hypothetical protein
VKAWERKDPLTRFVAYLEKKNLLDRGLEESIDAEIARGVAAFESAAAADPLVMFDHAYAELPPGLAAQRAALERRLARAPADPTDDGDLPAPPPMRGQRQSSRWQN